MGFDRQDSRTRSRTPKRDSRGRGRSPKGGNKHGGGSYGKGDSYGGNSYGNSGGYKDDFGSKAKVNLNDLVPFTKNFYNEHPSVANQSQQEIDDFRRGSSISIISKRGAPNPIRTFEEANFPDHIMSAIRQQGFTAPSPIQCQGWPVALSGKDMIGIAETGSGKTCSFALPALVHILAQPPLQRGETGPICLILAPTRELTQQIEVECNKFSRSSGVRCCSLVGGMPKGPQIRNLRQGTQLVIATPGRLLDLLDMDIGFNLRRVTFLCLDEADRMLDMGFEKPLRQICSQIRPDRQTLFWSATWPREVQSLAADLCREDPVHINIGDTTDLKANKRVAQHVEVMERDDRTRKEGTMKSILTDQATRFPDGKVIIFTKTKRGADDLERNMQRSGYQVVAIHGDKDQRSRDWALNRFKDSRGGQSILIATDVAARGLDVKAVKCVINYDFPLNIEDYVHRIGRTGRAGEYGESYSFFVSGDLPAPGKSAQGLINIMKEANQQISPDLIAVSQMRGGGSKGKGRGGYGGGRGGYGGGRGGGGGYGGGYGRY